MAGENQSPIPPVGVGEPIRFEGFKIEYLLEPGVSIPCGQDEINLTLSEIEELAQSLERVIKPSPSKRVGNISVVCGKETIQLDVEGLIKSLRDIKTPKEKEPEKIGGGLSKD